MEHILENLVNYIGEQMPDMKTVDEDYGQLEMIDETTRESYPLTLPAVLIDAAETSWSNVLGLSQEGVCTVRVRLISTATTTRTTVAEQWKRLRKGTPYGSDCICWYRGTK